MTCRKIAIVLVAALLAGGCDLPAVGGTSGVRSDGDGGAVLVLSWCEGFGRPARISLFGSGGDGTLDGPLMTLTSDGPAPAERFLEVPLGEPPAGWRAEGVPPYLSRTESYEVQVWNEAGDGRMAGPRFRPAELRDLVLTKEWGRGDDYVRTYATVDDFRRAAEGECG